MTIAPYREEDKMETMVIAVAVLALLGAFDVLAYKYGRDSRDSNDWRVHGPVR